MQNAIHECKFCQHKINTAYPNVIHTGLNNTGFMYCNNCPNVLVWSTFDVNYEMLVGKKHPWALNEIEKRKIESNVISCECNGRFTFNAKPRCPNCNNEIPEIQPDSINFIVLKKRIDSDQINIWKK